MGLANIFKNGKDMGLINCGGTFAAAKACLQLPLHCSSVGREKKNSAPFQNAL